MSKGPAFAPGPWLSLQPQLFHLCLYASLISQPGAQYKIVFDIQGVETALPLGNGGLGLKPVGLTARGNGARDLVEVGVTARWFQLFSRNYRVSELGPFLVQAFFHRQKNSCLQLTTKLVIKLAPSRTDYIPGDVGDGRVVADTPGGEETL